VGAIAREFSCVVNMAGKLYDRKVNELNAIGYSLPNKCSVPVETDCDIWGLTYFKIHYLISYMRCSVPVKSVTAKSVKDNKNQTWTISSKFEHARKEDTVLALTEGNLEV
jgi:hypothetical protein